MRSGLALALPALGALAILASVYAPGLGNGFLYDDHDVILVQPRPAGPADLARVFAEPHFRGLPYYRPVTRATLLAGKGLHGDRPAAFRAVNVALLAVAAGLAFALLRTPAFGVGPVPALLASLLFALHPVASSCVYPIASGRETLMPTVLILAAVVGWLRDRQGVALAAFGLALFAKEQAAVVPALFAWADVCRVGAAPPPLRLTAWFWRYAPLVPIVAVYAAARLAALGAGGIELAILEAPEGPGLAWLYALQAGFAPFRELVYEPELAVWLSPSRLGLALAATLALGLAVWRAGAPPRQAVAFWTGWFVLVQLPTSNVLRQEAPFAERYAFLALLAVPALAAGVVSAGWSRAPVRLASVGVAVALLVAAGATSVGRGAYFRSDEVFARQWLRTQPDSTDAHHLLGVLRVRAGDPAGALPHLRAALAHNVRPAEVHVNLAVALNLQGRDREAAAELETALRLDPGHPEAHVNLGRLLFSQGRDAEAATHYRSALAVAPWLADGHEGLGDALARSGRTEEARAEYREALRLDPGHAGARRGLERLEGEPAG